MWTPKLDPGLPAYQALAEALANSISAGELSSGERLPPQRELADLLGVTVGTVSRGYQLACQRGLTQGEVGRGTFVRGDIGSLAAFAPGGAGQRSAQTGSLEPRATRADPQHKPWVDLSMNTPSPVHDPNLSPLLSEIARGDCQGLLRYQDPGGDAGGREAGAEWLASLGLECSPAEVLISAGAQHGIFLSLLVLVERGAAVLCEELTYPGVVAAGRSLGLTLHAVAMDSQGMLPEALDRSLRSTRAKLVYTMPTLHNPTGATQTKARRAELAAIIERHQAWLVEDDILSGLLPRRPPPIASLIPERSVFIASLSKLLAGGLRVCFVKAPGPVLQRMTQALQATGWMTSPIATELARRLIQSGAAARVVEARRAEMIERSAQAKLALGGYSLRTAAAYHAWLTLPEPWSGDSFAAELAGRGVLVRSATAFHVGRGAVPPAVRLSLSGAASAAHLEQGLAQIRGLLELGRGSQAL